jgi:hypothetical protein
MQDDSLVAEHTRIGAIRIADTSCQTGRRRGRPITELLRGLYGWSVRS